MKLNLLSAVVSSILLTSCASLPTYYQVYDVETEGLKDKGELLVYENEDCTIAYSLWGKGGNLSFIFQNKLDENLYLIMPKCFLIHNGWALDYYDDNTYSYTTSYSVMEGESTQASLYGLLSHYNHWHPASVSLGESIATTSSESSTVTYKAPLAICIPAHSSKVIKGFRLTKTVHLECDKTKNNYPKTQSQYMYFDEQNTPLYVNNVLSYSTDPEGSEIKKIENIFWVKSITNYSEKGIFDTHMETDCATGFETEVKTFKVSQPNKFYNTYYKQNTKVTKNNNPYLDETYK